MGKRNTEASPARYRSAPFADYEAGESCHRDILSGSRVDGEDYVTHALGIVPDELLIHQDALAEPGVELALSDLLLNVFRLVAHLALEDPRLLGDDFLWHVLAPDVGRIRGHDVQREVLGKLLELLVAGHEIRLTVKLDENARFGVMVNINLDAACLGRDRKSVV